MFLCFVVLQHVTQVTARLPDAIIVLGGLHMMLLSFEHRLCRCALTLQLRQVRSTPVLVYAYGWYMPCVVCTRAFLKR
jgi:hypothetical protein